MDWSGGLQLNLYHFIDCFIAKGENFLTKGAGAPKAALGKAAAHLSNQHHPEFPRDGTTGSWLEGLKQTFRT